MTPAGATTGPRAGLPVIVLAGGVPRPGQPLFSETRGGPKALLELLGVPMVQWVLDALADSRRLGPVVVVGLDADATARLLYRGPLEGLASHGTFVDNLYAGLEVLGRIAPGAERALYCGSDIPLARGPMIDRFLEDAWDSDADVVAALVPRQHLESRFPDVHEDWRRLREGQFVAADLALLRPSASSRARPHLEALAPRRKSAWRQARQVGFGLLVRYLFGRLTLAGLERGIERASRIRTRVLIAQDPELGLDVDDEIHLEICRRNLAAR